LFVKFNPVPTDTEPVKHPETCITSPTDHLVEDIPERDLIDLTIKKNGKLANTKGRPLGIISAIKRSTVVVEEAMLFWRMLWLLLLPERAKIRIMNRTVNGTN
jgi:hypothetical protein